MRAGLPCVLRSSSGMRSTSVAVRERRSASARTSAVSRRSPSDVHRRRVGRIDPARRESRAATETLRRGVPRSPPAPPPPRTGDAPQPPSATTRHPQAVSSEPSPRTAPRRQRGEQQLALGLPPVAQALRVGPVAFGLTALRARPIFVPPLAFRNGMSVFPARFYTTIRSRYSPQTCAQRIGYLSQRRRLLDGIKHQWHQVVIRGGGLLDRIQRSRHGGLRRGTVS